MNEAEYTRLYRLLYDNARYIVQDIEAYNATNDRQYIYMIQEGAKKVLEYATTLEKETENEGQCAEEC